MLSFQFSFYYSEGIFLGSPFILLNYKTYIQGTGHGAVEIAKACRAVSEESGIEIAVAPQLPDIYRVASEVEIPVFSQHLDGIGAGSFTGHIFGKCIKDAGAVGTLINCFSQLAVRKMLMGLKRTPHLSRQLLPVSGRCCQNLPGSKDMIQRISFLTEKQLLC